MRRRRHRHPIRQLDIDFLCLAVFGQRALPDDMAERIAGRRELALAIARGQQPLAGSLQSETLEAVTA